MLMNTKEQSPLGEFKDFYFSDSGRTGLINLLNSTIYEIVQNSICGDKKRIELKFLFSFYSKQFIICDYGSIIDVQKSMFIDFFGLHIIDYLC